MSEASATTATDTAAVRTRDDCRLCGKTNLEKVWSFGPTPLANSYLLPEEVGQPEVMAPLDIYHCRDCHLVQLRDVVNPDLLFKNYLYVSSTSPSFVSHFEDYANTLVDRFRLTANDLVVDIGSNDGVLLKPLKEAGVQILGVDPAQNIAATATAAGIPTMAEYFTPEVAKGVLKEHGPARVITANNVFAHSDDIDTFVEAAKTLLDDNGVFVIEVQYLGTLLRDNLFDIVYHEHTNYYHLTPLVSYFAGKGLEVFDVEQPAVHGGSLRVYVQRTDGPHRREAAVGALLAQEAKQGLNDLLIYRQFSERIAENKQKIRQIIDEAKAAGKRVVGFGAPAKATTLMYAFGLTGDDIEYIVDDAPLKQGRVMPGTHIPIYPAEALYGDLPHYAPAGATRDKPDYCVILAWNFAEPIMKNNQSFINQGGTWIVPVPEPRVIN
ncbi:SAM-dependent methyltransferase [bacterium]|nr:SAM-dependent methyltransferase [bacterium]